MGVALNPPRPSPAMRCPQVKSAQVKSAQVKSAQVISATDVHAAFMAALAVPYASVVTAKGLSMALARGGHS